MASSLRSAQPMWLIWVVAAALIGDRLWAQSHMRPEVIQAARPYCKGALVMTSQRTSSGLGNDNWRDRSVLVCVPNYFISPRSYTVTASSDAVTRIDESIDLWPYLVVVGALGSAAFSGWKINVRRRPNMTFERPQG